MLVCERQPEQSFARRDLPLVERRLARATVGAIEAEAHIWLEGARS